RTVKTVEKSGTVIQVMGYFGIAIAILLLILVMSDLIQQAFFICSRLLQHCRSGYPAQTLF
ncbi:hypothetical protein ONJ16_25880, partial [Salmonella enterica subsp. enterica serovar Montevideo]|nr:hypothetical protein [Salmonella enterica subsp. enterica serovar Montevideo]